MEGQTTTKRLLLGGGMAGALVGAFLLGSVTLGVDGAQIPTAPSTPQTAAQQDQVKQEQQRSAYRNHGRPVR